MGRAATFMAVLPALVLGALVPAIAVAQPPQPPPCPNESPEELLKQGKRMLSDGKYRPAYEKFRCAHEKLKSHNIAGNLGLTELALEMYPEAAEHIAYSLRHWPAGDDDGTKKAVEGELAKARAKVITVNVTVDRQGSAVRVDGKNVGLAPLPGPIFLAPGTHAISARYEDSPAVTESVTGAAGDERSVKLVVAAAIAPPVVDGPDAANGGPTQAGSGAGRGGDSDKPSPRRRPYHPAVISPSIAASVVGAAVGMGMSLRASSIEGDIESLQLTIAKRDGGPYSHCNPASAGTTADCDTLANAYASRDSAATGALIGLGVATGAMAVTAALVALEVARDPRRGPFPPAAFAAPLAIGLSAFGASLGLQVRANAAAKEADVISQTIYDANGSNLCPGNGSANCQILVDANQSYRTHRNAALAMAAVGGVASLATAGMLAAYYALPGKSGERARALPIVMVPTIAPGIAGFALSSIW